MSFHSKSKSGSILIFVLWVLGFIAIFSVSVSFSVRQKLHAIERFESRDKLREIADAGIKQAIYILNNKQVKTGPDFLSEKWSMNPASFHDIAVGEGKFSVSYEAGGKVYYGVTDEESKFNINSIKSIPIIMNFLKVAAQLKAEDAHAIAAAIVDWTDEDDYPDEAGAESNYYKFLKPPYTPKNAAFDSLEELLLVKGMTGAIYNKIYPYLTLSGNGQINLNTASKVVLKSAGLNDEIIGRLITYRAGRDKIERTVDDMKFDNIGNVGELLNQIAPLSPEDGGNLRDYLGSGIFTVKSKNFRIESTAMLERNPRATLQTVCVTDREGNILHWIERFVSTAK